MVRDELIRVDNLTVHSTKINSPILKEITFSIKKAECVALKGPSGAGKTILAQALMGLTSTGLTVLSGTLTFDNHSYELSSPNQLRRLRGSSIAAAFQLPLESFNPLILVGEQISDSLKTHCPEINTKERRKRVTSALESLGFEDPEEIFNSYPRQLSGGQLQRCILSSATLLQTKLLIVDEPTASLDLDNASLVIDLLQRLNTEYGVSILLITHDSSIIPRIATRIFSLLKGELKTQPSEAIPTPSVNPPPLVYSGSFPLLEVKGLSKSFPAGGRFFRKKIHKSILKDISFCLYEGEFLGICGPSGSGKTTLAKCLVGLMQADCGRVIVDGLERKKNAPLQIAASLGIYYLWQNPLSCLDPQMAIGDLLTQPLMKSLYGTNLDERVYDVIEDVDLSPDILKQKPAELSGGQAQRIVLARLILMKMRILIADEPVSYLDKKNKTAILNLLTTLAQEHKLSMILISHDKEIISSYCNNSLTLKHGVIVDNIKMEIAKIIFNPELQKRNDLGILVFCENENSANSLAGHLDDQLLKKDYSIERHRVDDRYQDAGTIIEVLTNLNDISSIAGKLLENINIIISEGAILLSKGAVADIIIAKIRRKDPILQKPALALLSILNWSKSTDTPASIESDEVRVDIDPNSIENPEAIILKSIESITDSDNI